jgi:hypothetical protein
MNDPTFLHWNIHLAVAGALSVASLNLAGPARDGEKPTHAFVRRMLPQLRRAYGSLVNISGVEALIEPWNVLGCEIATRMGWIDASAFVNFRSVRHTQEGHDISRATEILYKWALRGYPAGWVVPPAKEPFYWIRIADVRFALKFTLGQHDPRPITCAILPEEAMVPWPVAGQPAPAEAAYAVRYHARPEDTRQAVKDLSGEDW